MGESAIIVPVAEAEPLVGKLRAQFDSSARVGVPAHITILYPFCPPDAITTAVLDDLCRAIAGIQPFEFCLATIGRFPGVLYLTPEPATPFVRLTEAIARQFPEYPPYGGRFQTIVPHLTIADGGDAQAAAAEAELLALMKRHGPVRSICDGVRLIENSSGRWKENAAGEKAKLHYP